MKLGKLRDFAEILPTRWKKESWKLRAFANRNLQQTKIGAFKEGWPRGIRECQSERNLANIHGTFYEIPREKTTVPQAIKPVCSHNKRIQDFCTWRGMFVISGTQKKRSRDGQYFGNGKGTGLWCGFIDDLWKLGKPVGQGGPWYKTKAQPDMPSDPYLMTGYDKKRVELSHDSSTEIEFTLEVDFTHYKDWKIYKTVLVPANKTVTYNFPDGFSSHWIRIRVNKECTATAWFIYE